MTILQDAMEARRQERAALRTKLNPDPDDWQAYEQAVAQAEAEYIEHSALARSLQRDIEEEEAKGGELFVEAYDRLRELADKVVKDQQAFFAEAQRLMGPIHDYVNEVIEKTDALLANMKAGTELVLESHKRAKRELELKTNQAARDYMKSHLKQFKDADQAARQELVRTTKAKQHRAKRGNGGSSRMP